MIVVRDLWGSDLESNGFVECLEALSTVGKIPLAEAREIYRWRLSHGCYTYVAVDDDEIVGTATLILERKFLHGGGWAGRVEEVAVRRDRQHQGIGTILMQHINQKAQELRCYKVVLCCTEANVPFYQRTGYRTYDIGMRQDFPQEKT
jgi:glucosamine-phosphate N-acetyltransferase